MISVSCLSFHPTLPVACVGTAAPDSSIFEMDLESSSTSVQFTTTYGTTGAAQVVPETKSMGITRVGPSYYLGTAVSHVMYWDVSDEGCSTPFRKATEARNQDAEEDPDDEDDDDYTPEAAAADRTTAAVSVLRRCIVAITLTKRVIVFDATSNTLLFSHQPTSNTLQNRLGPISLAKLWPPHLYFVADKVNTREPSGDIIFFALNSTNSKGVDKLDTKQKTISHMELHPYSPFLVTSHNNFLTIGGNPQSGSMIRLYNLAGAKGPTLYNVVNTSVATFGRAVLAVAFLPTRVSKLDTKGGGGSRKSAALFSGLHIAIAKLKKVAIFDVSIPGAPLELFHINPNPGISIVSLMTCPTDPLTLWIAKSNGAVDAYCTDDPLCAATEILRPSSHSDVPSFMCWIHREAFGSNPIDPAMDFTDPNPSLIEDALVRQGHSIVLHSDSMDGPLYSKKLRWPAGPFGIQFTRHPTLPYVLCSDPRALIVLRCGRGEVLTGPGARLSNRLLSSSSGAPKGRTTVVSKFCAPASAFLEPATAPYVVPPLVAFATVVASTSVLVSLIPTAAGALSVALVPPPDLNNTDGSFSAMDRLQEGKPSFSSIAANGFTVGCVSWEKASEVQLSSVKLVSGTFYLGGINPGWAPAVTPGAALPQPTPPLYIVLHYWLRGDSNVTFTATGTSPTTAPSAGEALKPLFVIRGEADASQPMQSMVSCWKVPQVVVDRCFKPDPEPELPNPLGAKGKTAGKKANAGAKSGKKKSKGKSFEDDEDDEVENKPRIVPFKEWLENKPIWSIPCSNFNVVPTKPQTMQIPLPPVNLGTEQHDGNQPAGGEDNTTLIPAFSAYSVGALLLESPSTGLLMTSDMSRPPSSTSSGAGGVAPSNAKAPFVGLPSALSKKFQGENLNLSSVACLPLEPSTDSSNPELLAAISAVSGEMTIVSSYGDFGSQSLALPMKSAFRPLQIVRHRYQSGIASSLVDLLALITSDDTLLLIALWRAPGTGRLSLASRPQLLFSTRLHVPHASISSLHLAGALMILGDCYGDVRYYTPLGREGRRLLSLPLNTSIVSVTGDRLLVFQSNRSLQVAFAEAQAEEVERRAPAAENNSDSDEERRASEARAREMGGSRKQRQVDNLADRGGGSMFHTEVSLFSPLLVAILQLERWLARRAGHALDQRKMPIVAQIRFLVKHYKWCDATSDALRELKLCGLINLSATLAHAISAAVVSSQSLLFFSGAKRGPSWPPTLFDTAFAFSSNFAEKKATSDMLIEVQGDKARVTAEALQRQCTAKDVTTVLDSINWYSSIASLIGSTANTLPGSNPSYVSTAVAATILSGFPKTCVPPSLLDSLAFFDSAKDSGIDRIRLLHCLYISTNLTLDRLSTFTANAVSGSGTAAVVEGLVDRISSQLNNDAKGGRVLRQKHASKLNVSPSSPTASSSDSAGGVMAQAFAATPGAPDEGVSRFLMDIPSSQFDIIGAEFGYKENNAGFVFPNVHYAEGLPTTFSVHTSAGTLQSMILPMLTAHWVKSGDQPGSMRKGAADGSYRGNVGAADSTNTDYSQSEASFVPRSGRGGLSSAGSVLAGDRQSIAETGTVLGQEDHPGEAGAADTTAAEEAAVSREQEALRRQYLDSLKAKPTADSDSDGEKGGKGDGRQVRIMFKGTGSTASGSTPAGTPASALRASPAAALDATAGSAALGSTVGSLSGSLAKPASSTRRRVVIAGSGDYSVNEFLRKAFGCYEEEKFDECLVHLKEAQSIMMKNPNDLANPAKLRQLVHYQLVCNIFLKTQGNIDTETLPLLLHVLQLRLSPEHMFRHCSLLVDVMVQYRCPKCATAVLDTMKFSQGQLTQSGMNNVKTLAKATEQVQLLAEAPANSLNTPIDEKMAPFTTKWSMCCGSLQLVDLAFAPNSLVRCSYCELSFSNSYVLERLAEKRKRKSKTHRDDEGRESKRVSLAKENLFGAAGRMSSAVGFDQGDGDAEEIHCEYCKVGFLAPQLELDATDAAQ